MRISFFSATPSDIRAFQPAFEAQGWQVDFHIVGLEERTAPLAQGADVVCIFVNDKATASALEVLANKGVKLLALRCAGYNQVDLQKAKALGIKVMRVPAYSPYAVAEHSVALMLTLNRKTHRAFNRVREGNFALEGLLGFDMYGKTAGLIGLGKIGVCTAKILKGFGCKVLGVDKYPSEEAIASGVEFVSIATLLQESDIVSLHCPLTPETHHLINAKSLEQMKNGVMLINTSRGALIDTQAAIEGLKHGKIGYLGLDVYEEEADLFFRDLSEKVIQDDVFMRLLTFPNVLITGHQAFFTSNAVGNIVDTTCQNILDYQSVEDLSALPTFVA